tara:strand:+ start:501 stop:719 length:219 start_codon:yes stop_codon:yes gene_type:complete
MLKITDREKCKRIIKYILMSLVMLVSLRYIPNQLLNNNELLTISFIASISFAILDMISPSILISQKTINENN